METRDEALEAAIDEVGRDRVFARMRAYGWSPTFASPRPTGRDGGVGDG